MNFLLPKRTIRGHIKITGRGIIRAPLIRYDNSGRRHEVIYSKHSNGIHRVFALHPLYRHKSHMIHSQNSHHMHGGDIESIGFANPGVSIPSAMYGGYGGKPIKRAKKVAKDMNRVPSLLHSMLSR